MAIKLRVREVAQKRGFTQKMLAEKLGLTQAAVARYYQTSDVTISKLARIAEALDCELWELIASEYTILQKSQGEVLTPSNERIKINRLRYCFDTEYDNQTKGDIN